MVWPVMKPDFVPSSRKETVPAISSGALGRRMGTTCIQAARVSGVSSSFSSGVSTGPGAMAFTRTPAVASSTAITLVNWMTPALDEP